MEYRTYGNTGKRISAVSLGGMRYAEPDKIDAMAEIPLLAAKLGVNYFDAAPGYSNDKSELILGTAVLEFKRQKLPFYLSTKTGASTADDFWRDLERSLKRLHVDTIDFYHCWGVNRQHVYDTRLKNGVIDAFRKAKEQKMIAHVVASSHMSSEELKILMSLGVFEGYTLGFCAINFPFRIEALKEAERRNLGVVTMNPLGGGMIPENPERFGFIRTRPDQDIVEAAIHFNLAHPMVTSALVGFRTIEDVKTAVAAAESFKPISPDEMERMKSNIEESFDSLCTTCAYCEGCPQGIPVHQYLEAYNHYLLCGKRKDAAINRMKWHWNTTDHTLLEKCIECGQCEEACTQKLPIISRLKELRNILK